MEKDSGKINSRVVQITELPQEVLEHILGYFSFCSIGKLRIVSKHFDNVCSQLLNTEFNRLKAEIQERYNYFKSLMPRRESSRKKHSLANENEVVEALHLRVILLNISLGLHVQKNHCCFFAGELLDELNRLLHYIDKNVVGDVDEITNELFDLSAMAIEYFKIEIEPTLPKLWVLQDSLHKSVDLSFKVEPCTTESTVLESDTSVEVLKKSLDNIKVIAHRNRKDLLGLESLIKSIEKDADNLESLTYEIIQHQEDCKEFVIPENDMNNILYKIDQCEMMINSVESQQSKPKRSKFKMNSSKNALVLHSETFPSICETSERAQNQFPPNDFWNMPSCSTSKVDAYDEESQQMKVSKLSKVAFSVLEKEEKILFKRKLIKEGCKNRPIKKSKIR